MNELRNDIVLNSFPVDILTEHVLLCRAKLLRRVDK